MRKWVRSGLAFGLSMLVSLSVCDVGRADDTKAGNDSKPAAAKASSMLCEMTERWHISVVERFGTARHTSILLTKLFSG